MLRRATGFFREFDHPTEGRVRDTRSPFRLHGERSEVPDRPAPRTGADGLAILTEVGFTAEDVAALVAGDVIRLGA